MKEIGIYIHVPFCKQKCKYCDFISFSNYKELHEKYFNCLIKEINNKEFNLKDVIVTTIYIGGGTPSFVLEKYIENVILTLKNKFNLSENIEITIEVNPGTVNKEKLLKYYQIGINRLSIGLQSTNERLLNLIGRIHTYSEFEETFKMARDVGFKNINVDLMIGLPTQSLEDVNFSVNEIINKNPEHISVYSLIVEEGTKMHELVSSEKIKLPNEEDERKMYWNVKQILEINGYNQYEISNFSKKGYESRHNMNCWNQMEYIGYGIAAHSYFNNSRFCNITNILKYIDNCENEKYKENTIVNELQSKEEQMNEYMLLGLRKIEGVNIKEFENKFNENIINIFGNKIDMLVSENLIIVNNNFIKLTSKGLDLANVVWMEFI